MPFLRLLLIAALAFFVAACSSKVNLENYGRLKSGQSFEEIVAVLGQPTRCDESLGFRQCIWGDDSRAIKVGFAGNVALTLSAINLK
jgi:hypothetical protein